MSILIMGMEMPECCDKCPFKSYVGVDHLKCKITGYRFYVWEVGWGDKPYTRHESCPLAPVPSHGRLIDADAFDERVRIAGGMADEELSDDFKDGIQTTLLLLKSQRTIIPAEPCNDLAKPNNDAKEGK